MLKIMKHYQVYYCFTRFPEEASLVSDDHLMSVVETSEIILGVQLNLNDNG